MALWNPAPEVGAPLRCARGWRCASANRVRDATAAPVAQILRIPDAPDARLLMGIAPATCRVLHRGRIARSTDRPTESRGAPDVRGSIGAATSAGGRDDGDLHGGGEHLDRR